MNREKLSNCVHWSYASLIGTSTTMSFWMLGMSLSLRRLAAGDDLRDRAVPALEEIVRVEHVVVRERRDLLAPVALHHRDAVLATDAAGEAHDQRRRLGRDPADATRRESRAATRALHLADRVEDRSDPVHRRGHCRTCAS